MSQICIVGAGLVGSLTALAFAKQGHKVSLFELRKDPSTVKERNLRSINLAVSNRGLRAVKEIDQAMHDKILENVIPMKGRMIHVGDKQESQLYGLHGEAINSIDRGLLNDILIEELKKLNVEIFFEHKLIKLDTDGGISFINHGHMKNFEFDYLIGADGAHSQFRYQLQKHCRMNFSQNYIDMQYMELYIPPKDGFAIDKNHLHIWPRHNFMLIALPNTDGSFTSTFFSSWSLIDNMNKDEWLVFFKREFPDAFELIGEKSLSESFNNPRGSLMQVDCYPYNSGKAIIIGDAAHSMVPFYGQGMNCGFEDVRILLSLIESHGIQTAFEKYSPARVSDLKAICKLALDNYHEMSSKVTSFHYLIKKNLDYTLGKFLNWQPLYTMVSFRDDIPYSKAIEISQKQDKIIKVGLITTCVLFCANLYYRYGSRR